MDNPQHVLQHARTTKRHYFAIILFVCVFAGLFWVGYRPWKERQTRIVAAAEHPETPTVNVVKVGRATPTSEIILPGALAAVTESSVYARAEGYIKTRNADIGDRVKAGQLLVEIDTPELDEQLRQARYRYNQFMAQSGATKAALTLAQANLRLAQVTLQRTEQLVKEGVFSRQEYDDKKAVYDVRAAEVAAAEANVKAAEEGKRSVNSDVERLVFTTRFQKVVAPFDGIITARNCEVGNLITAAAVASGRELFRLADPRELRVMINVPQPNAPTLRTGQAAELSIAEFPGRKFAGSIVRTANALDPASRTLLTEVKVDNRAGVLLPGMFGDVKLKVGRSAAPFLIPGDTPVVRADGTFVAVVQPGGRVHFQKLTIGRDLGNEIEVIDGLTGDELIVVNPGDDVREGAIVQTRTEKAK